MFLLSQEQNRLGLGISNADEKAYDGADSDPDETHPQQDTESYRHEN